MERLTGVIMERTGTHVVLMTPKGEFKRVRITGRMPDIGEEVSIPVIHRHFFKMPRAGWLAVAAAAVILLMVASPLLTMIMQPPEAAMAYVSIDINPSLDLTVSNRFNVLHADAFNQDGALVLKGLDLKGAKYVDAVSMIEKRAESLGFISKSNNTVVVGVTFVSGAKVNKGSVQKTLLASANGIFAENKMRVAAINVPNQIRDAARKKGMSPGKYAVLIEAVDAGLPVTEKDMQEKPIVVAISNAGGKPDQIIDKAGEENDFDQKEQKYLASLDQTSRQTVASADESLESGAASIAGTVYDKTNNQKKFVDSIRKDSGPEEPSKITLTGKPVASAVPSGDTTAKPAESTPTVGDTGNKSGSDANNTSDNTSSGSGDSQNQNNNGSNNINPDDNYMGSDQPADVSNTDNDQMYKLKPNF